MDYIHVVNLAEDHVAAIEKLTEVVHIYNFDTDQGTSVLQLVQAFEEVNNIKIPQSIGARHLTYNYIYSCPLIVLNFIRVILDMDVIQFIRGGDYMSVNGYLEKLGSKLVIKESEKSHITTSINTIKSIYCASK